MAMTTGSEYRDVVLQILQDTAGVRFVDSMVYAGMRQGLSDMKRLRPDIFMGVALPNSVGNATDMTFIDDQYEPAVVDYTAYYCEMTDQESGDVTRATAHRQSYLSRMVGGGA